MHARVDPGQQVPCSFRVACVPLDVPPFAAAAPHVVAAPIAYVGVVFVVIYVVVGGFVLFGSFFFGRLVTFFFPKNPLIRNGKREKDE